MSEKSRKICVFLPNWVGDAVMATPAIRRLYEYFGDDSTFTALGRPVILELFDGNPWFSDKIPLQNKSPQPEHSQRSVIRRLRQEHFDIAILFSNSFRTAIIAWFGKIKQRVGYTRCGRRLFLTSSLSTPQQEVPLVDYYLNLANLLVKSVEKKPSAPVAGQCRLELHTTLEEENLGDVIWKNLGLRPPEKVLMLNIGAASSVVKNWPIEHAIELCRKVVDQLDFDVLINCGPGETDFAKEIVANSKRDRVFSLAEQPLNIHSGKICLKRARLTVSTDSGPVHIAAAFGKPTIVLLGPTSKKYIANPDIDRIFLSRNLPCAPCYARKKCPIFENHLRCMKEITSQLVFEKIREKVGGC